MRIFEILYGTVYGKELKGIVRAEDEEKARAEAEKNLRPGFMILRVLRIGGTMGTTSAEVAHNV